MKQNDHIFYHFKPFAIEFGTDVRGFDYFSM